MASLIYDSLLDDVSKGNVNANSDSFKMLLVTSAYTPDQGAHLKRSDVTNEVANGNGYATGGTAVTCTVAKDTTNHKETWTFSDPSWAASSITARAGVIYKSRGGVASADELVAYVDFGADVTSTNDTFSVTLTSPLTIQN